MSEWVDVTDNKTHKYDICNKCKFKRFYPKDDVYKCRIDRVVITHWGSDSLCEKEDVWQ